MGGKEEVGWKVGKEKRQWVERSEGGQEERMIVTYNTNWLLQSTQFKCANSNSPRFFSGADCRLEPLKAEKHHLFS